MYYVNLGQIAKVNEMIAPAKSEVSVIEYLSRLISEHAHLRELRSRGASVDLRAPCARRVTNMLAHALRKGYLTYSDVIRLDCIEGRIALIRVYGRIA